MKKYIILIVVILGVAGFFLRDRVTSFVAFGAGRSTSVGITKCQTGTTTPNYLTAAAASSTCVIDIAVTKNADLHIFMTASTSPAKFNLAVYETYDELGATTDWYGLHTVSSGVYSISPTIYSVLGNTVSSSTPFIIPLNNLRGNRLKLEYAMAVANGAVYLEFIRDND